MNELEDKFISDLRCAGKYLVDLEEEEIRKYFQENIVKQYSEPHRKYHDLSHLEFLLKEAENFETSCTTDLAIWFHDIVYNVSSSDNEEKSANQAKEFIFKFLGDEIELASQVEKYILATKHGKFKLYQDEQLNLFLDIDLSILGSFTTEYDDYAKKVREEYSIFSDELYFSGRKSFLRKIDDTRIFRTAYYLHEHEERAHCNISAEIKDCDWRLRFIKN